MTGQFAPPNIHIHVYVAGNRILTSNGIHSEKPPFCQYVCTPASGESTCGILYPYDFSLLCLLYQPNIDISTICFNIKSNAIFCSEYHDSWTIGSHQNVIIGLDNILLGITFSHIVVLYMERE